LKFQSNSGHTLLKKRNYIDLPPTLSGLATYIASFVWGERMLHVKKRFEA